MIYPDRFGYAWTDSVPALAGRTFSHSDYTAAAEGCGIESTLFMEATAAETDGLDEAAYVDSLARASGSAIVGIVAGAWPESDGFADQLETLAATKTVGIRRVLHIAPDDVSREPRFRQNLGLLAERGLSFDICVLARQLRIAAELVGSCPDVMFVLDHCGVPDIAGGGFESWRDDLSRLAELPNVICKVSGLLAYCAPGDATRDAVRPYVEHSIGVFGWERVVWGSDWPVVLMTSSLRDWAEITREIVAGESAENQRRLFHENARRVYGVNG